MKHLIKAATLAISCAALTTAVKAEAQQSSVATISEAEKAAILEPINSYIKGHETGDGALVAAAFHKDALLTGTSDGKSLVRLTAVSYAKGFSGKVEADEAQRKRSFEILSVSGDAAVVVVVLDYPRVVYSDYMNLLKLNGKWKIAAKNFMAVRR